MILRVFRRCEPIHLIPEQIDVDVSNCKQQLEELENRLNDIDPSEQ